jgi:predicted small lipoprotein YifL
MKLTLIALLTTMAAPAFSGPLFFLPDHEPNGWRDTGCDETANVEIKGADGSVLYLNNPTCPNAQGGMDAGHSAFTQPEAEEEAAEEDIAAK